MKKTNNNRSQFFPVSDLREELRQRSMGLTARLGRSVARLTSCESLPCLEYGQEVEAEHALAQELFYAQHCRNALERCIAGHSATLRYRWSGGTVTLTRFRIVGPNRVKVTGLLESAPPARM